MYQMSNDGIDISNTTNLKNYYASNISDKALMLVNCLFAKKFK